MTTPPSNADSFPERFGQGLALVDYDNVCPYKGHLTPMSRFTQQASSIDLCVRSAGCFLI